VALFNLYTGNKALRQAKKTTDNLLTKNKSLLDQSRFEEGKAWLERANGYSKRENASASDRFAAALMAGRAIGFAGYGRESQTDKFRERFRDLLNRNEPETGEARTILNDTPGWQIWQTSIFQHHQDAVMSVTFSPDGKTLASAAGWGRFAIDRSDPL